jgi:predicted LPLAT superfamily acyltransferase
VAGIRLVAWLLRTLGLGVTAFAMRAVAWYFVAFAHKARRASRVYLSRVGQAPSLVNVHRHMWMFAQVALHRILFLTTEQLPFQMHLHGHEEFVAVARRGAQTGRGALMIGAHLGSFEAMRALAVQYSVPLTVLVDFRNAEKFNRVVARLRPPGAPEVRMLQINEDDASAVLGARDCIERGELVALLGDRVTANPARNVEADFLGAQARWPTGPYLLAHLLDCPVFLVSALFTPPLRYDVHCVPFDAAVRLPRSARAQALGVYAQRYADALAAWAKSAPYNWFNFFDFWSR